MLLGSRANQFIFSFPHNFFYPEIERRYEPHFKRFPVLFTNLTDFMSHTVQSVSWPAISTETVEQINKNSKRLHKGGWSGQRYTNPELTVTFRTTEGYLNYLIIQDMFYQYWELYTNNNDTYVSDLDLKLLDHYGYMMMHILYTGVVFSGLSELELSYASNVPEYRTFSATFTCAYVRIMREFQ